MNQRVLLLDDLKARATRVPHTIYALDLFCGAGGFTAGLLQAGIKVLAGIDFWEAACVTYRKNFDVPAHCIDICTLTADHVCSLLGIDRGVLDLMVGTPPIPLVSTRRIEQKRPSGAELLLEFARLVADLAPKMFLLECPDKVSIWQDTWIGKGFARTLNKAGYQTQEFVLDAVQYGVPQFRRRRYIVGQRLDQQVPFVCPGDPSSPETKRTVWEAIGNLDVPSERVDWGPDPLHYLPPSKVGVRMARVQEHNANTAWRQPKWHSFPRQRHAAPLRFDQPSPSINTEFIRDPRFVHPYNDRPITLREAARWQTFSDDFDFTLVRGRTNQAKLIGGATPPRLGYVLGRFISSHFVVEAHLVAVNYHVRTAIGSASKTWGTLLSEPFQLLPKPSPALRYLLSADGATSSVVVSRMLRDIGWSPFESSKRDGGVFNDGIAVRTIASYRDMLRLCELIGLCYQDEKHQIHVTRFGTTVYRWLDQLNERNSRLLCSYAIQALAVCQLDSPVRRLSDAAMVNVFPFICIWRALQALDGWLSTEELNRALFHVMKMEELEHAILQIANARRTHDVTQIGPPAIPLAQATPHVHTWMSLASFGWTLLAPEPLEGTWCYRIRSTAMSLLEPMLYRQFRVHPFSTVHAYVNHVALASGVPEDVR